MLIQWVQGFFSWKPLLHSVFIPFNVFWNMRWNSWLRHCATSRKVADSMPDGVIGIFHWHNPSGCTMALGLTQPLAEMTTRNISSGVKAASVEGWQPYHLHVLIVLKSGSLNLLEPSRPVQACYRDCFLPFAIAAWSSESLFLHFLNWNLLYFSD